MKWWWWWWWYWVCYFFGSKAISAIFMTPHSPPPSIYLPCVDNVHTPKHTFTTGGDSPDGLEIRYLSSYIDNIFLSPSLNIGSHPWQWRRHILSLTHRHFLYCYSFVVCVCVCVFAMLDTIWSYVAFLSLLLLLLLKYNNVYREVDRNKSQRI